MNQSLKDKLDRNIWITRKCRINASERLLNWAKYIEFINIYFSIWIIILSILSIVWNDENLSIISLICSITLTITITYANATNYRERAATFKHNYIELQLLLDELSYTASDDKNKIMLISKKYAEILESSENHTPMDMYKMKCEVANNDMMITVKEKMVYYWKKTEEFILKLFLVVVPIIVIFVVIFFSSK